MSLRAMVVYGLLLAGGAGLLSGCASSAVGSGHGGQIQAVGAESQYANVISQIGGQYVEVAAIESNPNTDPHSFEASPSVANEIAGAQLVVQNGLGYDTWANKIEAASPNPKQKVIDVQQLLKLPDDTPNPHLWYQPATMPKVARAVADDLSRLAPGHASYFAAKLKGFDAALQPWDQALASFKASFAGTPVAVTEPVGDYLLQAAGCGILTPFSLQAAIMNGTDPSPQNVTTEDNLLAEHRVKVFVYNQQVTDPLTQSFLSLAQKEGIPVVAVYETMPTPGYNYQSWMLAEVEALHRAVVDKTSTTKL